MLQYRVNKCLFKSSRKLSLLTLKSLKLSGNEFLADGPATEKAHLPYEWNEGEISCPVTVSESWEWIFVLSVSDKKMQIQQEITVDKLQREAWNTTIFVPIAAANDFSIPAVTELGATASKESLIACSIRRCRLRLTTTARWWCMCNGKVGIVSIAAFQCFIKMFRDHGSGRTLLSFYVRQLCWST